MQVETQKVKRHILTAGSWAPDLPENAHTGVRLNASAPKLCAQDLLRYTLYFNLDPKSCTTEHN